MAILKPKRGSGLPTGLQQNELAIDILNKRIYLGNTGGTGDIVSSHITDYIVSLNGATGTVNILGGTGISVISPTGAGKGITLVNQGVLSLNGSTGAVTNVALTNTAQTFTALQSFSSGISASGGTFSGFIRFNSGLSSAGGTFTALTRFTSGLSASGATFSGDVNFSALNGRIIANHQLDITGKGIYLQGISSGGLVGPSIINLPNDGTSLSISSGNGIIEFNNSSQLFTTKITTLSFNTFQSLGIDEYYSKFSIGPATDPGTNLNYNAYLPADTGTIALTKNVVSSFNGLTGSITGVTTGTANTFGPLQSFTNGMSSAGGTFASQVTFLSGITCSGGATFATDIVVNSVAIGLGAGNVVSNVRIGSGALVSNTTGSQNVAIGTQALQSNTTFSQNVAIGRRALNALSSGGTNVSIGANSLLSATTTNNCISLGANSAGSLITGTGSIYIGASSASSSSATENEIVIGTSIAGLGSNTTVIGPTTQVSATIRGLVNAPSGLSASGISSGSYILTPSGIKALTGTTYTFLASDNGTVLTHNNSSGCTFTVPTGLPVGYSTTVLQLNSAGTVRFVAASGVTLNAFGGFTSMAGQHASASLISYTTNIFNLSGNLI